MDNTIISAIITGTTAIVAPIAAILFSEITVNKSFKGNLGRTKALPGVWRGFVKQKIMKGKYDLSDVEVTIDAKRKRVHASIEMGPLTDRAQLKAYGGLIYDDLLSLDYKNRDEAIKQAGHIALRLNAEGNKLDGHFHGFGPLSEKIVQGRIHLEKQI